MCFYFLKIYILVKLHFCELHGMLTEFYLKAIISIHEVLKHLTKICALAYFFLNVTLQSKKKYIL